MCWLERTVIYYLLVSVGQESRHGLVGSSAQGPHHQGAGWAVFSFEGVTGEGSASKLIQVVGKELGPWLMAGWWLVATVSSWEPRGLLQHGRLLHQAS